MTARLLTAVAMLAVMPIPAHIAGDKLTGRRVYVLHSGVHIAFSHPSKNRAAEMLKKALIERGVPERDIIVLDNPFPTASWSNAFPRDGLTRYLESTDPSSVISQDAYQRLSDILHQRGIKAHDEIIWVGHSAGGQVGMTMAHLAHNLDRYPSLARTAKPYRFGMVVTLGTAVGANPVPERVRLRHYHSPGDHVVELLCDSGETLAGALGYAVRFRPACDLGPNGKVRIFAGIDHHAWYRTPRVVDAILAECESNGERCRKCAPRNAAAGRVWRGCCAKH